MMTSMSARVAGGCQTADTPLPAAWWTFTFVTMTSRRSKVLVVALATTLAVASMGCGLIGQAKDLVDNATALSDFAERLGRAQTLTYTAEYSTGGSDTVTLVQQPPNVAYLAKDSRFMFTAESVFLCSTEQAVLTCQKSPNSSSTMGSTDGGLVAGVAGPGFITPELALGLILAAALVPGATVTQSDKTIAGQSSKCASATNLEAAAEEGDTDVPKEFTVCVTDDGVLASFSGTSTAGEVKAIELTKYSDTADAAAFAPPEGAKIVDVTQIQPNA
jgi:hypothetical protein